MEEIKSKEIEKFESKMNDHDEAGGGDQMQKNGGKKNDQKTTLRTPADIYEHPSFYSFILDMPGLDAQNIKVKVENGILHVSGKKKKKQIIGEPAAGNEGVKVIRIERRRARYMRKFTLAADASHEDVKAAYKDGVLSITVVKNNKLHSVVQVEQSNHNILTNNVSIS
ncbi:17.6 kDa class II heat shock protein [Beta vulgaris subsp. vulgaris]|uniref:17.6 kDa class II heat shock protein n=1 Tax=Beta vulgaris subsp. vulgaris TaxID=3555 RepID=UPI00053F6B89|nr:17.6 kDa class II heat shock protein [Beta vulgaris subsp. vulgaris]